MQAHLVAKPLANCTQSRHNVTVDQYLRINFTTCNWPKPISNHEVWKNNVLQFDLVRTLPYVVHAFLSNHSTKNGEHSAINETHTVVLDAHASHQVVSKQ